MKKVLSLFLSILMLCSIAAGIDLSAQAAGNTIATATSISLNTTNSGSITDSNTKDVYKFTLPSSGRIDISATAYMTYINYYILDSSGSEIWSLTYIYWDSSTGWSNINKSFDLTKGTYYFVAAQFSSAYSRGKYSFAITFSSAGESFSETQGGINNSMSSASSISLNTTYKGQIAENDDTDTYKFTLASSGKVTVSAITYTYRLYYYIYNSSGYEIWSGSKYWDSSTGWSNINESIDLSKGTYYFIVAHTSNTGNYTFAINCVHSYSSSVTKKATTSAAGTIKYTCKVCGATKTGSIAKIGSVSLSSSSYTYNGKAKSPTVTVKNANGSTINSSYYTVTYINRSTGKTVSSMKSVGKYYVKVTFKGKYSGTVKKAVTIKPKSTSISSVTAKSKGFTVKWSKVTTGTTGYQVQYSTSSDFSSKTTKTISSNSTTSKKITGLKAKKKYYVRVRTYKTVKIDGKSTKIYSSWSKAKSVTTKK